MTEQQPRTADDVAREIVDAKWPTGPMGIAAAGRVTGHRDGDGGHPAWCSPLECTAYSGLPIAYHLSAWRTVYPRWGGEVAIRVRLYATAYEPMEAESPQLEILFDRAMSATSIEGYELSAEKGRELSEAVTALVAVAADPEHWMREVAE